MAKIKRLTITNVKDIEELEFSLTSGGNAKLYDHFAKEFDSFLKS